MLRKREVWCENPWSAELYEKHNPWVLDVCQKKGKKVLIWKPSMGWRSLCEFMDKKEPGVGVPEDQRAWKDGESREMED